ncbi:hypothetical protein D3C77_716560 [compost metagenome]
MIKAVFAANDQSDEGAVPLIYITKVTRSTLARRSLPLVSIGISRARINAYYPKVRR